MMNDCQFEEKVILHKYILQIYQSQSGGSECPRLEARTSLDLGQKWPKKAKKSLNRAIPWRWRQGISDLPDLGIQIEILLHWVYEADDGRGKGGRGRGEQEREREWGGANIVCIANIFHRQ